MPPYLWRQSVRAYLGEHLGYFALVGLLFGMGVVFGALTVNNLGNAERQSLLQYMLFFLRDEPGLARSGGAVVAHDAIWINAKTLAFLFILSITAVGAPLILLVVFTRGFVLGFTVGFLVKQLAFKGFLFALMAVVPHNLILIPALLTAAVANLDFGLVLIRSRFARRDLQPGQELLRCLAVTGLALLVLFLAGLVEGYISPVLMGVMANYLT